MVLVQVSSQKIRLTPISEIKEAFYEKKTLILIVFISLSLLVPFFISQFKPIYMPTRQPIVVLFAFVLILAAILEKFVYRSLLVFFCWCLLLTMSFQVFNARINPISYLSSSKYTADYLLENANKGDFFIFTSHSYYLIGYYFRLADKENLFVQKMFPSETSDFSDKAFLAIRAKSIVDEIDTSKDINVWVVCENDPSKIGMLLKELDSKLKLKSQLGLQADFHNTVFLYKP